MFFSGPSRTGISSSPPRVFDRAGKIRNVNVPHLGQTFRMMAEALPDDGHLITCEIDPKAEAIARRYFAESPHGDKITIRMGPALDTTKTLAGPLDLVFIDADKVNYSDYYEACLPLLKSGGLVVADNVLWSGKVVDPKDADDHAIVAFNRLVQSDPRVKNVCLTVRDGMMLAWKRAWRF